MSQAIFRKCQEGQKPSFLLSDNTNYTPCFLSARVLKYRRTPGSRSSSKNSKIGSSFHHPVNLTTPTPRWIGAPTGTSEPKTQLRSRPVGEDSGQKNSSDALPDVYFPATKVENIALKKEVRTAVGIGVALVIVGLISWVSYFYNNWRKNGEIAKLKSELRVATDCEWVTTYGRLWDECNDERNKRIRYLESELEKAESQIKTNPESLRKISNSISMSSVSAIKYVGLDGNYIDGMLRNPEKITPLLDQLSRYELIVVPLERGEQQVYVLFRDGQTYASGLGDDEDMKMHLGVIFRVVLEEIASGKIEKFPQPKFENENSRVLSDEELTQEILRRLNANPYAKRNPDLAKEIMESEIQRNLDAKKKANEESTEERFYFDTKKQNTPAEIQILEAQLAQVEKLDRSIAEIWAGVYNKSMLDELMDRVGKTDGLLEGEKKKLKEQIEALKK